MASELPALINQAFTAIARQIRKTARLRRHEEPARRTGGAKRAPIAARRTSDA